MSDGESRRRLRVGIVGHRNNIIRPQDTEALTAKVEDVLERIARVAGERGLTLTSPLAEGADRIGARVALSAGYTLECPLPFERSEYEKDFASEESRREFREMLDAAERVWELPGVRERSKDAYYAVGRAVLDASDVLVAIWDGEEARGRGGTAEVVAAATERMPVVWIHPDPRVGVRMLTLDEGRLVARPLDELEGRLEQAFGGAG
jgi:hypothetical protein